MTVENDPRELVGRGLEHMGGAPVISGIERVRFEFVTQWQITSLRMFHSRTASATS